MSSWPISELTAAEVLALPAFAEATRAAVGAIVLRQEGEEVLLLRRELGGGAGSLDELPGGEVGPDETVGDAVRARVLESTSLAVEALGDLWFGFTYESRLGPTIQFNYAVTVAGVDDAPVVVDPFEHTSYRWARAGDLANTDLTPTVAQALLERIGPPAPP